LIFLFSMFRGGPRPASFFAAIGRAPVAVYFFLRAR
jgi:hypothetical protein